ncbi:MAG TPA: glycosyltransferase family 4 protein [Gaiellaceae bacterium]|nr:glycosyltransferase family 4 protein [Gaiellaceae bacterium]
MVAGEREPDNDDEPQAEAEHDRHRQRVSPEHEARGEEDQDERRRAGDDGGDPRGTSGERPARPDDDRLGDLQRASSPPRRPRLLVLVTLAEVGGAQAYVASLLPTLVRGFQVTVAAYGPGPLREAAAAAGARFVPLRHVRRPISPWRDLAGILELVRLLRRERPDIVHANSSKAGVLGRLAAVLTRVPIRIFTVHGWAFSAHSGAASHVYRAADRLMRPLTTATICVSERERARGLEARTCDPERTVVIPNAVDVARLPRASHDDTRASIVSVGRLAPPKDFRTLVRALALLPPGAVDALLVGDGPDRAELEAEIARLDLGERVELAGERHDVPELLSRANLFVLSSLSEGLPVSVLEAMAAGLPVVGSSVGGVPELVGDGETGFLVEPGNPDELAAAIGRLLADPELRRRMGEAGRERARVRFALEPFWRAHLDLYSRELARRRLPAPALIR